MQCTKTGASTPEVCHGVGTDEGSAMTVSGTGEFTESALDNGRRRREGSVYEHNIRNGKR
jgi:hypothetical protein